MCWTNSKQSHYEQFSVSNHLKSIIINAITFTYFYIVIIYYIVCVVFFFLSRVTCAAHACVIQLTKGYLIPILPSINIIHRVSWLKKKRKRKRISTLHVCQKHTDHV